MPNLFAVGDIHGCALTLHHLLTELPIEEEDTIVFLGDYVDRGPRTREVLELLTGFDRCNAVFLRGNHDQMMLDAMAGEDKYNWEWQGGAETVRSYGFGSTNPMHFRLRLPDHHFRFLRDTELVYQQDGYTFVHAGFDPMLPLQPQVDQPDPGVVLWERSHIRSTFDTKWEGPVICGHTVQHNQILRRETVTCIDRGCCFPTHDGLGYLAAINVHTGDVYTYRNRERI